MSTLLRMSLTSLMICYALILSYIVSKGLAAFSPAYLFGTPEALGRSGGIWPMLRASLVIGITSSFLTIVIGIPSAFYLAENKASWLTLATDSIAGMPSIVFGLVGHVLFVQTLGLGYSLLSGVLTLTFMVLPFFTRLVEDAIRQIPESYRLTATVLQIPDTIYRLKIALPLIWPAFIGAIGLSWTRAIGETAALLFTSGYSVGSMADWSFFASERSLSVHIFDITMNLSNTGVMPFKAATALLIVTLFFLLLAKLTMKVLYRCLFHK